MAPEIAQFIDTMTADADATNNPDELRAMVRVALYVLAGEDSPAGP